MERGLGDPRNLGHEKALDVRSILLVNGHIYSIFSQCYWVFYLVTLVSLSCNF